MNLSDYLLSHSEKDCLSVIGPFFKGKAQHLEEPKVYVDAGTNFRFDEKGFAIGDNDSFDGKLDEILPPEKDFSDLSFALHSVKESAFKEIRLYGFLGGRRDHELMNLAEAHSFLLKRKHKTKLHFDESVCFLSAGVWELDIKDRFSIFAFQKINIKLGGDCIYKLNGETYFQELSSHGLSNEAFGKVFIEIDQPLALFFYE